MQMLNNFVYLLSSIPSNNYCKFASSLIINILTYLLLHISCPVFFVSKRQQYMSQIQSKYMQLLDARNPSIFLIFISCWYPIDTVLPYKKNLQIVGRLCSKKHTYVATCINAHWHRHTGSNSKTRVISNSVAWMIMVLEWMFVVLKVLNISVSIRSRCTEEPKDSKSVATASRFLPQIASFITFKKYTCGKFLLP